MNTGKIYVVLYLLLMVSVSVLAQQVNVTRNQVTLEQDSVRITLKMDVSSFFVSSDEAVIFTPVLKQGGQLLDLPPVMVCGKKRMMLYKREHSLRLSDGPEPYQVLLRTKKEFVRPVQYKVSIPYASWMDGAMLCLRSEYRDCCTKRYLSFTTLIPHISLRVAAVKESTQKLEAEEIAPDMEKEEVTVEQIAPDVETVRIDYHLGRFDVKVSNTSQLASLIGGRQTEIENVLVLSYASPEGMYGENEKLARLRAENVREYICNMYDVNPVFLKTIWVAENWDGLIDLLQESDKPYRDGVIGLIGNYGIFSGREKQLMDYWGGWPYKEMLREMFPRLRYTIVRVKYRSK